ncbi:uncharacterized protein PAC_13217 [Phialocephala subalpina]|uniref:Uncharacterized protein n=1 Tax=Phialocephala subalpina TaxID=576137 RepID=A0A1L7XE51_9HELO|nr:uncharacterized protein PAC_13217 [Phialocephala subalpina]
MASDNESTRSSDSGSESGGDVDASLRSISNLKLEHLKKELGKAGIKFEEKAPKPELQAILALWTLGRLVSGQTTNQDAAQTIEKWCKMPVPKLGEVMGKRKMKNYTKLTKWERVESLIKDEFDEPDDKSVKSTAKSAKKSGSRGGKSTAGESSSAQTESKLDPQEVSSDVVNLLVSSIYNMVVTTRKFGSIHGYGPKGCTALLDDLDSIPAIKDASHLKDLLAATRTSSMKLLRWICDTYGSRFVVLSDDNRIRGFETGIPQFAVLDDTGEAPAVTRMSDNGGPLFFHGTSIASVLPILTDGFKASEGLCVTAGPNHAIGYAHNIWLKKRTYWKNSPYPNYGALLGCQIPGQEEPVANLQLNFTHPELVTVRYMFLIPPPKFGPTIETVEPAMLAGIKAIREGKGRSLEKSCPIDSFRRCLSRNFLDEKTELLGLRNTRELGTLLF